MSAMLKSRRMTAGFTIIELMVSLAIGTLMLVAVGALIPLARETQATVQEQNRLNQEAHFAMARMVRAVSGTRDCSCRCPTSRYNLAGARPGRNRAALPARKRQHQGHRGPGRDPERGSRPGRRRVPGCGQRPGRPPRRRLARRHHERLGPRRSSDRRRRQRLGRRRFL